MTHMHDVLIAVPPNGQQSLNIGFCLRVIALSRLLRRHALLHVDNDQRYTLMRRRGHAFSLTSSQ
jgi:hypothetical protein|tara:strand:+ start:716 stop:910 length:195 start_codon:yes stop_codon:yes gene_type:complete